MNLDRTVATRFLGHLHEGVEGLIPWVIKLPSGRVRQPHCRPGRIPGIALREAIDGLHIWVSVASCRDRRGNTRVLDVPALWADMDPEDGVHLDRWRRDTLSRLGGLWVPPTIVVDSGRGFHGYWVLDRPIRIETPHDAYLVVAGNRSFERLLDGDSVSDLARVMRLPGTINPKNQKLCRIEWDGGPKYGFQDLLSLLGVPTEVPGPAKTDLTTPGTDRLSTLPKAPKDAVRAIDASGTTRGVRERGSRGGGRPRVGVTTRDLRTLRPWARQLIIGGAWRAHRRYTK